MRKIEIEFPVKSSIKVLYAALTTPSGLTSWFCDNIIIEKKKYWTFIWEDSEQKAELIEMNENKSVKFQWLEQEDTFFEFKIVIDDITGDAELIITDFCEEDEVDTSIGVWESQVKDLFKSVGA